MKSTSLAIAVSLIFAPKAVLAQDSSQVISSGNCTINIVRSSARDVRVTGCAQDPSRVAALQKTINAIFANQSVAISRIDDMIEGMNLFFAANAKNQDTLLAQTAESNDKLDRVIDFLESFQEKPEDAAGLIPLLSNGTLSHIQERKPFGIQLVRIVKHPSGQERIILRLVKSGPEQFDIATKIDSTYSNKLVDWNIIGLYGTTCTIAHISDVMPLATFYSLKTDNQSKALERTVRDRRSNTRNFPLTLILSLACSGEVAKDERTLNMRFHYKPEGAPTEAWDTVDFRFDASKVTQLYAGPTNRGS